MILRVVVLVCAFLVGTVAHAERKAALLIGNAAYSAPAIELRNPPNDINAMKATLEGAGFEVTVIENAGRAAMSKALARFEETVVGAEIGLIYYSGHGIEVSGDNFLVPIDAKLTSDRDVKYEAILLDDLLHALAGATKLKLVLLDACRDNPFLTSMKRVATRGVPTRGLARVDSAESNMLIGYATAPGDVALDGEGSMSPYASALAQHLATPGLEIEIALRAVAKQVYRETKGRQRPYISGSLFETVLLGGPLAKTSLEPSNDIPVNNCPQAEAEWNSIKAKQDRELISKYLSLYGSCDVSATARWELERLTNIIRSERDMPQRRLVILQEYDTTGGDDRNFSGTIVWRLIEDKLESIEFSGSPVIQGKFKIPERGLSGEIQIRRNEYSDIAAKFIIQLKLDENFNQKDTEPYSIRLRNGSREIKGMARSRSVRTAHNQFTFGITDDIAKTKNINSNIIYSDWLDITYTYDDGKLASLSLEKNAKSGELFAIAFDFWTQNEGKLPNTFHPANLRPLAMALEEHSNNNQSKPLGGARSTKTVKCSIENHGDVCE